MNYLIPGSPLVPTLSFNYLYNVYTVSLIKPFPKLTYDLMTQSKRASKNIVGK